MNETVNIEILGHKYRLKSDVDEEHIHKLVHYVNNHIDEVLKKSKTDKNIDVVILAILNITDDFFRLKKEMDLFQENFKNRFDKLIESIDSQE